MRGRCDRGGGRGLTGRALTGKAPTGRALTGSGLTGRARGRSRGATMSGPADDPRHPGRAGPALRARLRHVYWVGGGSGAGKSTTARRLAGRAGLRRYSTDDVMADHARRSTPEDSPFLSEFGAMDMDERWVRRSPEAMLETFHWFRGEGFGLIVDDLLRLPRDHGVIAEGFRLLPHRVRPLLALPGHAVWLLPTPEFRRAAFASRGSLGAIAGRTSDPERALRNLLERDRLFTERLGVEARRLDLRVIEVGGPMTEDDLAGRVAEALGL
jgi:hypothetical protein